MKEQQGYTSENVARRSRLTGQEFIDLFCTKRGSDADQNRRISREVMKGVAQATKKHVGMRLPESISNDHGVYFFSEEGLDAATTTAHVISTCASFPSRICLPETSAEREALAQTIVNAFVDTHGQLHIVTPVCPDYGKDATFYRVMGGQIGSEARAAISASQLLSKYLPSFGIYPNIHILVADTEDDNSEILANCAEGDVQKYHASCQASAKSIAHALKEVPRVTIATFSEALGNDFRMKQYAYEEKIRSAMRSDSTFKKRVTDIAQERVDRHSQILNRAERDYELTIRYMAQYAALGSIVRTLPTPSVLMNYETPNRAYFNAAVTRHPTIQLSTEDMRVIPVLRTVRGR